MKKFNFRLQKVMEYKEHREKDKQRELAQAREILQREKEVLSEMEEQKFSCEKNLLKKRKEKVNLRENHLHQVYLTKIVKGIKKQEVSVRESEKECSKKIENLLETSREKKSLEKLKGKKLVSYLQEILRAEQKEIDEFARDVGRKLAGAKA
jgi:flagellar FliJ protein